MEVIVTSADVYSALDAERPFGSLRRVGGGAFRFQPSDGSAHSDHKDYDSALAVVADVVTARESDPDSELKIAQARIVVLEAKLREAGIDPTAEVVKGG